MRDYKTSVTLIVDEGRILSISSYEATLYFEVLITYIVKIITPVLVENKASGSVIIDIEDELVEFSSSLNPQICEIQIEQTYKSYKQLLETRLKINSNKKGHT